MASYYFGEESGSLAPNESSKVDWTNGTDQFGQPYTFNAINGYGWLTPNGRNGVAVPYTAEERSYYVIPALSARQNMAPGVLTES